jgi:hypothetical protein
LAGPKLAHTIEEARVLRATILDMSDPLALQASPNIAGSVRTYTQIEERVLGAKGLEAVALRYGFFYGPGTWFPNSGYRAVSLTDSNPQGCRAATRDEMPHGPAGNQRGDENA